MASQPPDTGRDRNQVRPLRSTVSSVRGKANRHRSTGVFGSHFVLDCGGSRKQAARFQDLLQQPSHPYLNGRANTESACVTSNRKSPLVSMATSLSILISDTSGCVIFRRLSIAPVSGQPWEDFQLNHLVLAFLVAARFADPIVSLQPYQFARDTFPASHCSLFPSCLRLKRKQYAIFLALMVPLFMVMQQILLQGSPQR